MAVEAIDAEKLAKRQAKAISEFFGMKVPKPGDWLLAVAENIRETKLFPAAPFYLPNRQLAEGVSLPGLKRPLDEWLYEQMRAGNIAADADWLPGDWILFDITRRPDYDKGKQMYPDTPRFKELLASLRKQGQVLVPDYFRGVPEESRFAFSADEIDGDYTAVVAKAVAAILDLKVEQITTPPYATFNYIGNLDHSELGQVNTSEWFRNKFEHGGRLFGGGSGLGGLGSVYCWGSGRHNDDVGFRLQIASSSQAA